MQEVDYSRHLDVKHWGNRTIPWKVCKAFSVIYETKTSPSNPRRPTFLYLLWWHCCFSSLRIWCTASWLTNAKERCQRHICCWKMKSVISYLNCQLWEVSRLPHSAAVSGQKIQTLYYSHRLQDTKKKKSNCRSITMDW